MTGERSCLLTVLMPVHDGEAFLQQAIDSILCQSYEDFECLIVDDGSRDRTPEILTANAAKDGRIRVCRLDVNLGTATALNYGLGLARGQFIARMDADDVALPFRLEKQVDFMRHHPEIDVCGSALTVYERPCELWTPPLTHDAVLARMLFECPVFHPTVIMRTSVLRHAGGYLPSFSAAQDYELWCRLALQHDVRFANIAQPLLQYRTHPHKKRPEYKVRQRMLASIVRDRLLAAILITPSVLEQTCHKALSREVEGADFPPLDACFSWIQKIEAANRVSRRFIPEDLRDELQYRSINACNQAARCRRKDALRVLSATRSLRALPRIRALVNFALHWLKYDDPSFAIPPKNGKST